METKKKKTYVQPNLEVVELHVANQLLAGSATVTGTSSLPENPEEIDLNNIIID